MNENGFSIIKMVHFRSALIYLSFLLFVLPNSFASVRIIKKEIIYISPGSGQVNLVWGINGWEIPDSLEKNNATNIKGILYTSLVKDKGAFRASVFIPFGATLDFVFQTTLTNKNEGVDIWDNNGAEGIDYHFVVTDEEPIVIEANFYSKKAGTGLNDRAWIILGLSLFIPLIFICFRYFKKVPEVNVSYSNRLMILALSLFFFHILTRFEIIAHFPQNSFEFVSYYKQVLAASLHDLAYITLLSVVFLIPIIFLKIKRNQRIFFYVFCFLAAVSVAISILNIAAVHYLGRPFNYQWLYYSGFLGSTEAKNAVMKTGIFEIIRTILILCAAMFFMAYSLVLLLNQLSSRIKPVYFMAVLLLPLPLITLYQSTKSDDKFGLGKTENPVSSFFMSMVSSYLNPSLFEIDIPPAYKYTEKKDSGKVIMGAPSSGIKNVLLIVLESAGAEYFDLFGGKYSISPNMNKLASNAILFDQAYASSPATNKSLVSILCSRYPWLSYKSLTQEVPDFNSPSLSSVLHHAGYKTSYFTSADSRFQNGHVFLSYRDFDRVEDFAKIKCEQQFTFKNSTFTNGNGMDDSCLVNRFERWLEEVGENPFFTMLWTNQAHYPYFVAGEEIDYGVESPDFNRYINALHHYDDVIGGLYKVLKKNNLDSNTLVVIVGDHGEAFGRHKQFGHATKLYEENIKAPLLFIHPNFTASRDSTICELKDIASTILPILGFKNPEMWQGRNLLETNNDEAFYFAPWSEYLFGYRKKNKKFIFDETNKRIEVFDLKTDINESNNLFEKYSSEELNGIRYRLASWVQYQDSVVKKLINKQNK